MSRACARRNSSLSPLTRSATATAPASRPFVSSQTGYALSLSCTIPLLMFPLKEHFFCLAGWGAPTDNLPRFYLTTVAILAIEFVLSIKVPNITVAFGIIGSTVAVLIGFVIPAWVAIGGKQPGAGGWALLIGGVIVGIVCFSSTVYGMCAAAPRPAAHASGSAVQLCEQSLSPLVSPCPGTQILPAREFPDEPGRAVVIAHVLQRAPLVRGAVGWRGLLEHDLRCLLTEALKTTAAGKLREDGAARGSRVAWLFVGIDLFCPASSLELCCSSQHTDINWSARIGRLQQSRVIDSYVVAHHLV